MSPRECQELFEGRPIVELAPGGAGPAELDEREQGERRHRRHDQRDQQLDEDRRAEPHARSLLRTGGAHGVRRALSADAGARRRVAVPGPGVRRVDRGFWRSIYKCSEQSGGPYVTGWINVLFPYLDAGAPFHGSRRRSPIERNPYAYSWQQDVAAKIEIHDIDDIEDADPFGGTTLGAFPRGLSQAPLTWHYLST